MKNLDCIFKFGPDSHRYMCKRYRQSKNEDVERWEVFRNSANPLESVYIQFLNLVLNNFLDFFHIPSFICKNTYLQKQYSWIVIYRVISKRKKWEIWNLASIMDLIKYIFLKIKMVLRAATETMSIL